MEELDPIEFISFDFCEVNKCYMYRFDYAKFYNYLQQLENMEVQNEKRA